MNLWQFQNAHGNHEWDQSAANKNEAGKAAVGEVLVALFLIMYFENVVFESYKT